jgi:hypothetical protein
LSQDLATLWAFVCLLSASIAKRKHIKKKHKKKTKDLATSPETRVVGKTFFVFFGCFLTIEAGRQMSIV